MGPKHWSLFVTYDTDEEALGTIYQVCLTLWHVIGLGTERLARRLRVMAGAQGSSSSASAGASSSRALAVARRTKADCTSGTYATGFTA